MCASSKRDHVPFNRSVYSPMNKCSFVPNCAFETLEHSEKFYNSLTLHIYSSDNKAYKRAVLYKTGMVAICGFAGLLFNAKTKEIMWQETNPADRKKGYMRQLRALLAVHYKAQLWAVHLTIDGAASMGA